MSVEVCINIKLLLCFARAKHFKIHVVSCHITKNGQEGWWLSFSRADIIQYQKSFQPHIECNYIRVFEGTIIQMLKRLKKMDTYPQQVSKKGRKWIRAGLVQRQSISSPFWRPVGDRSPFFQSHHHSVLKRKYILPL